MELSLLGQQCYRLLEQWYGEQRHHPLGPSNQRLFDSVGGALRGGPDGAKGSEYIALAKEIRGEAKPSAEAVWLGGGKVCVGDEPITLESQFADVLQSLVELRTATEPQLVTHSGHGESIKLLKKLVKKFPRLAPYIHFPGKRGAGGYSTTIAATPK